jgi:hypothetical protein
MNYRLSTLFARKSYAADATEVIDINVSDPISQLIIELSTLNVGDIATAHAIACLKKIEIVDGSDVLFSLSGYEAEAVDIYHNKRIRSNWNPYIGTMGVQRFVGINFGRKLWDPELAFDPKKFSNPQLKITLDIDAGGNAPSANYLQVWAALFDEKMVSPIGLLMHKEIKDYPMAVSAHEYTDLPVDYPYRKLFVRQQTHGTEPDQHVDNIKLSEDQDKRIIFDHGPADLCRTISAENPMLTELIMFVIAAASRHGYCTMTSRVNGVITPWALANAPGDCSFYDGDGGEFHHIAAAGGNAQAIVGGWYPHATFEIPFGDQDDPDDWFDASMLRALRLDVKATAGALTTDSVQVFLQQLRKY